MPEIKLKTGEADLLRSIAHAPRTLRDLTHSVRDVADIQMAPHTVRTYLDHLCELGLLAAPEQEGGHYRATEAGFAHLANQPQLVASRYYGNASMEPGSYRSEISKVPARGPGALRAFGLPSRGIRT